MLDGDTSFLRLQDTGDPRDYGFSDPGSIRKLYFGHDITAEGASLTVLDEGVTISFRARVATTGPLDDAHPDGGAGITPWPAEGDGYVVGDGGKHNFTIKQGAGGAVAFALALPSDLGAGADAGGLIMNNLNGNTIGGDVDPGEPGTLNLLPLADLTAWHEFWITIQAGGEGTHRVEIYRDGALSADSFDVTAGDGSDFGDISYLGISLGSTGQSGAIDVDFLSWKAGAMPPVPEPSGVSLLSLGLIGLLHRRRAR